MKQFVILFVILGVMAITSSAQPLDLGKILSSTGLVGQVLSLLSPVLEKLGPVLSPVLLLVVSILGVLGPLVDIIIG